MEEQIGKHTSHQDLPLNNILIENKKKVSEIWLDGRTNWETTLDTRTYTVLSLSFF